MRLPSPIDPAALDLAGLVRPGDTIVVGQGTSEPLALTEALVAQRHALGGIRVFLGVLLSDTFAPEATDGLSFAGYGGIGKASALTRAGRLDVVPCHYGSLPQLFERGYMPADVVMLQLNPGRDGAGPNLGLGHDYIFAAARKARVVIAQINDKAPWTPGAELPEDIRIDVAVEAPQSPVELKPSRIGEVETRIAAHVAGLIPDGATIELGIGSIPDAILTALSGHRDLGVHTGMIVDRVADLMEAGVITNARKPIDTGVTAAGLVLGTERLFRFADRNGAIGLRPPPYTHGLDVIARLPHFVAMNSAVEVDLTGQVNAEMLDGAYVGGVGGQVDFVRAALAAPGGRSVIALPATARQGTVSRIVPHLSGGTVTTLRSDADTFVTEWGVAELRGQTFAERARRMIAIAAPDMREHLAKAAHELLRARWPGA